MNPSIRAHLAVSRVAAMAAGALLLQGCASALVSDALSSVTPYKVEIVQGNVVTREQLAQLKPGMTRGQVRDVLGAPMLTDIFHADRWDYPFTIRRKGVVEQRRNVVVGFTGEIVKTIEAPELPSEREFVAGIGAARPKAAVKLELTDEERAALPAAKGAASAATVPNASGTATAPKRDYPALEADR